MSTWPRIVLFVACFCVPVSAQEPREKKQVVLFDDPLGQVEVGMPPMGGEFDQTEREVAPKLIKELRFVSKMGPAAVLISTRIRPDLPKDDRVLQRVEPKYRNFKQEHGEDDVVLEFRGKSPARTLEFALAGGEYGEAFPYVVGGKPGTGDSPESVTISQFFVSHDRMFEVALFLPNSEKSSRADLLAHARKLCDQWRSQIVVKR